jgi:NhaA family Na+:H+ antiporter
LVLGKPLGILLACFVSVKLGVCALPRGVHWSGILALGTVAGIGFTMAIFIAQLAFSDAALLAASKLAVLVASFVAAVLGLLIGRVAFRPESLVGAAVTVEEAEASTEH